MCSVLHLPFGRILHRSAGHSLNWAAFQKKNNSKSLMQVRMIKLYRREELVPDSVALLEADRLELGLLENNKDLKCRELFSSEQHFNTTIGCLRQVTEKTGNFYTLYILENNNSIRLLTVKEILGCLTCRWGFSRSTMIKPPGIFLRCMIF